MKKHLANLVTGCRILGSILMLFFPVFSSGFYATYLLCGVSDMVDGTIARITNSSSKFGEQLDSFADILFLTTALIKLLPVVEIPAWLWLWISIIAILKFSNLIRNDWFIPHTVLNKVTGFALFLFPLTLSVVAFQYTCVAVCILATVAALHEAAYAR